MKTGYIIAPVVILVLVLAAFSTPAMAQGCLDDIKTRECAVTSSGFLNGTITNGSVIVLENSTGPCDQNWTIILPPGEVVVAYVHWHRWGECENHSPTAEFWNGNGQYQSISIPDTLCPNGNNETRGVWYSGKDPDNGNHHYYWRVNATPGVNIFRATGCYDTPGEHCDDRWFFAVINNTTTPYITHSGVWWHNYGYKKITQNPYSTWFYNATIGPVSKKHNYTLWVAQSHYDDSDINMSVNNHLVGTIYGPGGYPFSLYEFNVPGDYIETNGSQEVTWDMGPPDDYFYGYFATLAEKAELNLSDLKVKDIMFPEVMNPGTNYTIKARIKNKGDAPSGTFNVSLEVDGNLYDKVTGVGPLSVDANIIVSFTNVSLSEGCHNFTVIADCDNDVYEGAAYAPSETNNARTEYYQVGNVIVVHNNSQLMSHSDFINRSGIYYLENKTITNCAGCGITIENTTLPIVIQNCTVHDCNYEWRNWKHYEEYNRYKAGICLRNVTNVTIDSNTIVNNTNAGIRVQNSTHVDIMDNYISDNTKYGIYVYPDQLVEPPYPEYVKNINITNNTVIRNQEGIDIAEAFNCTVSGNTVRNNTKYGIYVCGNYNCIYNNTIVNNSVYGMYLFNASHNIIFWNDFIDNNKTNSEYPKHQAYDMWKGQPGLNPHNHWNSTISDFVYKHSGTGSGGSNVSYMGNYWDNDTCTDANNDGICDSPYKIDGATAANDYYPLKEQWRNYTLMCGDVDASGGITTGDVRAVFDAMFGGSLASKWAADVDCSGGITTGDVRAVFDAMFGGALNCCSGCNCPG